MTDEELEVTCFSLITAAGAAKSLYVQAMQSAREGDFKAAESYIEQADKTLVEGHAPHTKMVQREAAGEPTPLTLLLVHAEDQMASTETFKLIAQEAIKVYRRLAEDEAKLAELQQDGSPQHEGSSDQVGGSRQDATSHQEGSSC